MNIRECILESSSKCVNPDGKNHTKPLIKADKLLLSVFFIGFLTALRTTLCSIFLSIKSQYKNMIAGSSCFTNRTGCFYSLLTRPAIVLILSLLFICPAQAETASWYGNESICWQWGGHTRNGEMFDESKLTCAMPSKKQINKWYLVTNLKNGKSVKVWANDTGSFAKYGRAIDLSKSAFAKIADLKRGLIEVKIEGVPNE